MAIKTMAFSNSSSSYSTTLWSLEHLKKSLDVMREIPYIEHAFLKHMIVKYLALHSILYANGRESLSLRQQVVYGFDNAKPRVHLR
jgi:hypothetical protein